MITVVIPAYNAAEFIADCLASVASQTFTDFDVVVVDDGSTDETARIAHSILLSRKFRSMRILSKPNGGVSSARNAGVLAAEGEWVAFLDSDDTWHPEKLRKQVDFLKENPSVDFVGCNRNDEEPYFIFRGRSNVLIPEWKLYLKMYPQTSTALIKKSLLLDAGLYDESMRYAEDGDLWLRLAAKGNIHVINESLVVTGGWKANYGASGLSANLPRMHAGVLVSLRKAHAEGRVGIVACVLLTLLELVKYRRRLWVSRRRRNGALAADVQS